LLLVSKTMAAPANIDTTCVRHQCLDELKLKQNTLLQ